MPPFDQLKASTATRMLKIVGVRSNVKMFGRAAGQASRRCVSGLAPSHDDVLSSKLLGQFKFRPELLAQEIAFLTVIIEVGFRTNAMVNLSIAAALSIVIELTFEMGL